MRLNSKGSPHPTPQHGEHGILDGRRQMQFGLDAGSSLLHQQGRSKDWKGRKSSRLHTCLEMELPILVTFLNTELGQQRDGLG
jgi:hypothetical protein